jgi:SAM-dependent methyltransferase
MLKRLMRVVRDLRWRRLNWSSASDEAFHDRLFAAQAYDPFSHAYPGNITIRRFADLAAPHVDARGTVLDLGCGPGEITCELARRFPGATFIGVDHSGEAIRRATANAARLGLANISFVAASLQTYEPPSPVQLVTMFDSFHHLLEPRAFVERFRPLTERFFLIEPAGNALGQWRESSDFDWVAVELDAIREKLDHIWGIALHAGGTAAAPETTGGEPVERRYTQDDFEAFFDGFSLTVTGTTSGLVSYPPSPQHHSEWRDRFGRHAYEIFTALDDRLVKEGRDLWSRHWAIVAVPGPRAARRPPEGHPLKPAREVVRGGYSIEYLGYAGPDSAPADTTVEAVIGIRNTGSNTWSSEGDAPVNVSYRWLTAQGLPVPTDQLRRALPRSLSPGEEVDAALAFRTPPRPGRYVLAVDLVREGVTWFSERGQPPKRVKFRVTGR